MTNKRGKALSSIEEAVQRGFHALIQEHPEIRGYREVLQHYLDSGKITSYLKDVSDEIKKNPIKSRWNKDQTSSYVLGKVEKFVKEARAFNRTGQILIFRRTLDEQGDLEKKAEKPIRGIFARRELREEDNLNKSAAYAKEFLELSQQYKGTVPEPLVELAYKVYQGGFLRPMLRLAYEYGRIGKGEYKEIDRAVRKRMKKESKEFEEGSIKYSREPHNIAAAILSLGGLGLLIVSGLKMTGNAVALSAESPVGVIAGVLLVIGSALLWKKGKSGRSKSVRVARGRRKKRR